MSLSYWMRMAMIAGEKGEGGKSGSFPAVWRKAQVDRGGVPPTQPRWGEEEGVSQSTPTQVCTLQVCKLYTSLFQGCKLTVVHCGVCCNSISAIQYNIISEA